MILRRVVSSLGVVLLSAVVLPLTACVEDRPGVSAMTLDPPILAQAEPLRITGSGQYLAGRHAQAIRDAAAAADFFAEALKRDPENPELLRQALAQSAADGRMGQASDYAARLLTFDSEDGLAAYVVAQHAAKVGDYAKVERVLANLPRRGLSSFLAPLMIAWAQAAQNRYDAALETLKPMKAANHTAAMHDFHAALINEVAGRAAEARALYDATMANPLAFTFRAMQVAASFHARQGDIERTRSLYRRYRLQNPDSALLAENAEPNRTAPPVIGNARQGMAEALFGTASSIKQGNMTELALVMARLALDLDGGFGLAYLMVGDLLDDRGRFVEANALYEKMPASDGERWTADLRRAENLARMKKPQDAATLLRDLAKRRPNRADALIILGDTLRSDKRFEDAAKAYEDAEKRLGKIEQRHWAFFYSRGIAYERSQQWPKAEADFQKALELQPDQPLVLNYLGYSWVDQGLNLDRARGMIEKAVSLRPNDGYIIDSLGWALYRMGDFAGAVKQLERAIEIRPEDPVINDHLGDAYWRVGRKDEARFQWNHALSLDPEADQIEPIKAKIAKGLEDSKTAVSGGK